MQPIQRRAILAILSMIEAGVRELRAALTDTEMSGTSAGDYRMHDPVPRHDSAVNQVLSDAEESSLEQIMEKHRMDLLNGATSMAQDMYGHPDRFAPELGRPDRFTPERQDARFAADGFLPDDPYNMEDRP